MKAKAVYANTADTPEELSFKAGDVLTVLEKNVAGLDGWWLCSMDQRTGIAPGNRLKILSDHHEATSAGAVVKPQDGRRKSAASEAKEAGDVTLTQTRRRTASPQTTTSFPDYDVPQCNSTTDYDIPVRHEDQVSCTASNRSSIVSNGSQSSVTSSNRDHRHVTAMSPTSVDVGYSRSVRDSVLDDYDVPRSDVISDESNSADSGVYCGVQRPKLEETAKQASRSLTTPVWNGIDDSHDYDVPEPFVTRHRSDEAPCQSPSANVDSALTIRRDNVLKNINRLEHWVNENQSSNQWSVQFKLAGLALKTSLQELITLNNRQQYIRSVNLVTASFVLLSRCLDSFVASSSLPRQPYSVPNGNRGGYHHTSTTMTSPNCSVNTLETIRQLLTALPAQVRNFTDEISTSGDFSTPSEIVAPPAPLTRTDSARNLLNACNNRSPSVRRKPPPVKPKPPKQLVMSIRRQHRPETNSCQDSDGWSDDCDYANIATEAEMELGVVVAPPVRPRQLRSATPQRGDGVVTNLPPRPPASSKAPTAAAVAAAAKKADPVNWTAHPRRCINDADREIVEFYSTQIASHTSIVESASRDFFQCTAQSYPNASSPSLPAEIYVRRSRFVVLAAHKLVYLADSLARHVTDDVIRERVAVAANELCERLKAVVRTTKQAALAAPFEVENCELLMVDAVSKATLCCRHLTEVFNEISQW